MTDPAAPQITNRALAARIWREYLQPRRSRLGLALLSAAVIAALSAGLIAVLKPAVDQLITHPQPGALVRIPLLIAAIAIARGLFQVLQTTSINRIGNAVVGDVQVQLFGKLVRADLAHLGRHIRHLGVEQAGERLDVRLLAVLAADAIGAAVDLDIDRGHQFPAFIAARTSAAA